MSLQVLNQQMDPSVAIMQQGVQGINEQLAKQKEDAMAIGALKVKLEQMKINATNAASEQDKIRSKRLTDGLAFLVKLKEMGADPNLILPALKETMGDQDAMEVLQQAGASLSKVPSAENTARSQARGKMAGQLEALQGADFGNGQGFPPGTTMTPSGLTMPLNPPLTAEEARITSSSGIVDQATSQLIQAVKDKKLDNLLQQTIVDMGNPMLADKAYDELISAMNALKGIVPFAKGGKQLTKMEADLLFRLLNTQGKSPAVIIQDMQRFQDEFNALTRGVTKGTQSVNRPSSRATSTMSFNTPEQAQAAADAGQIEPGMIISIGGKPFKARRRK